MKSITGIITAVLLGAFLAPGLAAAEGAAVSIEANANFWWMVAEQNENGVKQPGSNDKAAQETSGFNFKQGRLAVIYLSESGKVEGVFRIRIEERMDILDAYGAWHAAPWFTFQVGMMKIPSTAEVLTPDHLTDFVDRSSFGENVGDFSLARTPYISSLMNARAMGRDTGMAIKGEFPGDGISYVRWFVMASNGSGAYNYVGGPESPEFFYANNFGDYYYGGRLELEPFQGFIFGGHISHNLHRNTVLSDKKTVVDLDRYVWSADLAVNMPWGTRLYGFYGKGRMEDFFNSTHYIFDYDGFGVQAMQSLFDGRVELGTRYDSFTTEFMENNDPTTLIRLTYGLNLRLIEHTRVQANYTQKRTGNDYMDDIDDDFLVVNFQFIFPN